MWGPASEVVLETEMRGSGVVPCDLSILTRTGLDLNPLDPADPEDRRWLEALIWPEHHERRSRLTAALEIAAANPVGRIAGDGLVVLPQILSRFPGDDPVVVINSFVLNQFHPEDRDRYEKALAEARRKRPVHRVSMEWLDPSAEAADVAVDDGSGLREVGRAQPHGEWLDLYARP